MKIIGTGSAHPSLTVTNAMLEKYLDTNDEWIMSRTGIRQRQLISSEKLEDIAATAARNAMDNAGVSAKDIDFIIVSNVVNEYITPGLGCVLQGMLGATCPTIDINCACAGFIYALSMADAYLTARQDMQNILIICAEEPARMMDWNDRATCVLFGDGAGSVVVTRGEGLKGYRLNTASKVDALYQMHKLQPTPFITKEEIDGPCQMNGKEVFKLAVSASINDIDIVLKQTQTSPDEIDLYVLHQANVRIIESIRHFVQQDKAKFPINIDKYGNTSSATIPILLDELNREGKLKNGDLLLMSAFGAGFTTGACILRWTK